MNRDGRDEIEALKALGDQLREVAEREGNRRRRRRFGLASGGLAALLAAALFTTPGAALAEKVTVALGIGKPASLPPTQHRWIAPRESAVIVSSGITPDGDRYEMVASRVTQTVTVGGARPGDVAVCLTMDFVEFPDEQSTEICLSPQSMRHYAEMGAIDGVQAGDRYQYRAAESRELASGRYYLYGLAGSHLERVEVAFDDPGGGKGVREAIIGRVDADIAQRLRLGDWAIGAGMMVAFLPDDGQPAFRRGSDGIVHREPGVPGSAVIEGYDSQGRLAGHHDLGKLYRRSLK